MLDSRTVSANSVIAGALWITTAALLVLAAVLVLVGRWKFGILVAETACCVSAGAAVRHMRCYMSAICRRVDDLRLDGDVRRVTGLPRPRQHLDH